MLTNSDFVDKDKPSDNKCTTLRNTNDASNNKLIENNISDDLSQLNLTQCEYLINLFNKNENADINTQDEEVVLNIVKKNMKHIFPSNKEDIEINTQQFMDLNISRVIQQLRKSLPNISKIQTDSDNSVVSITSKINKLRNPEQNKKNCLSFNKPKKLKKDNKILSVDLELSDEDLNSELLNQDQDPEIITFRSMCETMMNVIQINNDDSNSKDMINYKVNYLIIKQVNADVINCIRYKESVPSVNRLNDTEQNFSVSESMGIKKRQYHVLTNNLSDDSSSEHSKISQNKKSKFTLQNTLNVQSKSCSNTIISQFNGSKKSIIDESPGDENDCVIIENKLSKVHQNTLKNDNQKRININSLQQNKRSREIEPIFYCSPDGMIHNDMLDYIHSNNNI